MKPKKQRIECLYCGAENFSDDDEVLPTTCEHCHADLYKEELVFQSQLQGELVEAA